MEERPTLTAGFVSAAVAVAAGLIIGPTDPLASQADLAVVLLSILAGVTAVSFSARRHGRLSAQVGSGMSLLGGIGLLFGGLTVLGILPTWYAIVLVVTGLLSATVAMLDWRALPPEQLATGAQYVLTGIAVVLLAVLVAGLLASLPRSIVELSVRENFIVSQLGLGIGFIAVTFGFLLWSGRGLSYLDIDRPGALGVGWMVAGTILIVVLAVLLSIISTLLGIQGAEHTTIREGRSGDPVLLLIAMPLTVIATAVGEEVLFRNGLQKYLTEQFTPVVAILMSCAIFALVHIPAYQSAVLGGLLVSLTIVFSLSLVLAVAYHRTGNLWVPIVIHGAYNVLVFLVVFLDVIS